MLVIAICFRVRKTQVQCNFHETQTQADIIFKSTVVYICMYIPHVFTSIFITLKFSSL